MALKYFKLSTSLIVLISALSLNAFAANRSSASIQTQEIKFFSSKDGVALKGTLTLPESKSRGIVLMLVGSGKVDRDVTIPSHRTFSGKAEKLFVQLSDTLVTEGYTTFRYDKRGIINDNGGVNLALWKTADREHLISDAVDAAKTLLKITNELPQNLILLGHSEGTILATETALALGGSVRALLLFEAQARSMKNMLYYQIVESRSRQSSGLGHQDSPEEEYEKALEMIANSSDEFAPDGKPINWYRQYLTAPANVDQLIKINGKKYIFQGEMDPQTPISEVDIFVRAGVDNLSIKRYPELGHGFSPDKEGKPTLGPIVPAVLTDLRQVVNNLSF